MTRYRAAFGGLSILAVAVSATFDVHGQAKSTGAATMRNSSGNVMQTCTNYQFTLDAGGTLDVTCTGVTPTPPPTPAPTPAPTPTPAPVTGTEPGKVQFHSNSFTVNRPASSTVNVPITIDRIAVLNPASGVPAQGAVTSTIKVVSGDCVPKGTSIPFTIADGQLSMTLPANSVTATGSTACGIAMLGGDVSANVKFTSTFVAINVVPDPTPAPTPAPTPSPTVGNCTNPAGQLIAAPGPIKMQTMYMGGTNNYAVDDINFVNPGGDASNNALPLVTAASPSGSIQVFTIPKFWSDGVTPAPSVHAGFVDWLLNGVGVQYEIALSTCPGDFSYYKTATASDNTFNPPAQPCGVVSGPTVSLNWSPQGDFRACRTNVAPNATWYMNWRIVPGTAAGCATIGPYFGTTYHTCGHAFGTNAL